MIYIEKNDLSIYVINMKLWLQMHMLRNCALNEASNLSNISIRGNYEVNKLIKMYNARVTLKST